MANKSKGRKSSSKISRGSKIATTVNTRVAKKPSMEFRRLSPSELWRIGLSQKSERYVSKSVKRLTRRTTTISKRQLYQKKLFEQSGRRITLERRAREYLTGERWASTASQAALRERSLQSWGLRRRYRGERVQRVREHLRNMELKAEGEYLDVEVYLREKAFAEAHLDISEERGFYQKWFNYGHIKKAGHARHNASGRTI